MSINTPFTATQIYLSKRGWRPLLLVGSILILATIGAVTLIEMFAGRTHG